MKKRKAFEFEDESLKCYRRGTVGIVRIKKSVFEIVTDITESWELFELLESAEADPDLRVLLLMNDPDSFSAEAFDDFVKKVYGAAKDGDDRDIPAVEKLRARQIHILNQFILQMLSFRKIFVTGLQGSIVTPIFGASLISDFRYVADNMRFSLTHGRYGLHPSGALPFFLQRYLGTQKTTELLYRSGDIPADEALKLGLIDRILPLEDFEEACLDALSPLMDLDPGTVEHTKRLTNRYKKELDAYIEFESSLVLQMVYSKLG